MVFVELAQFPVTTRGGGVREADSWALQCFSPVTSGGGSQLWKRAAVFAVMGNIIMLLGICMIMIKMYGRKERWCWKNFMIRL